MPDTTTSPQAQGSDPPVVRDGKLITRGRINSTDSALALHATMFNNDRHRSRDRSLIQQLLDNLPPVDPQQMESSGRGNCSNFNPGDAETVFAEEISPYVGLAYAGRTLFTTPVKDFGSPIERAKWATVIAEEITDMIRGWSDFLARWELGVSFMKRDGVAFDMHDDPINWQWKVHNQEQLKYPSNTQIGVNNFNYISMEVPCQPSDLYEKIMDGETAQKLGWNLAQARQALMDAAPDVPKSDNWEAWERSVKNNDYFMNAGGGDNAPMIKLIHVFCKELDGKVSHYITRSGDEKKEFIFKSEAKFEGMDKFLYPLIENLGSNGTYHGIRGVGHKIYSKAMEVAVLTNKFADLVDFDTTPIIQGGSNAEGDEMETISFGYFSIFPNTYKIPDRQIQNYSNSIIPAIEYFRGMMSRATSKNSQKAIAEDSDVSRYVLDAVMRNDSQVSGLSEFLFYTAKEALFREVTRRVVADGYEPSIPGGREAADFRKRCHDRGVPAEALKNIDFSRIRMNRVIGGGNENIRAMKLQSAAPIAAGFDPVGKSYYQHDVVAAIFDEQTADLYSPVTSVTRLPDDAGIAQVENNQLVQGMQIVPLPGQNDEVHCMIHIRKLNEFGSMVEGQSLNLVEVTPAMRSIADHVAMHIQNLPLNSPSTKEIIEVHEQYLGMIENGELQIMRMQEAAANEAAQNGGQPGSEGQPTPEQIAEDQKISAADLKQTMQAQLMARQLLHKARMMDMDEEERQNKLASQRTLMDMKTALEARKLAKPAAAA